MADKAELGINVKTTNNESIKKVTQDVRLLGAEAKNQSEVLDTLTKALQNEQKAAGNLAQAFESIISGSTKYTEAVRREAAATLLNMGAQSQVARQFLSVSDANDKVTRAAHRAAEEEEKAAARSARLAEQRARAAEKQAERIEKAKEREAKASQRSVQQQETG